MAVNGVEIHILILSLHRTSLCFDFFFFLDLVENHICFASALKFFFLKFLESVEESRFLIFFFKLRSPQNIFTFDFYFFGVDSPFVFLLFFFFLFGYWMGDDDDD
ncbi:hypothetical protein ACOSQ3_019991 [Xanthoceras sorbifolium]